MEQILPNRIAGTLRMVAWIVRKGVKFWVVSSTRITYSYSFHIIGEMLLEKLQFLQYMSFTYGFFSKNKQVKEVYGQ